MVPIINNMMLLQQLKQPNKSGGIEKGGKKSKHCNKSMGCLVYQHCICQHRKKHSYKRKQCLRHLVCEHNYTCVLAKKAQHVNEQMVTTASS